jgi:hypothetical protein
MNGVTPVGVALQQRLSCFVPLNRTNTFFYYQQIREKVKPKSGQILPAARQRHLPACGKSPTRARSDRQDASLTLPAFAAGAAASAE